MNVIKPKYTEDYLEKILKEEEERAKQYKRGLSIKARWKDFFENLFIKTMKLLSITLPIYCNLRYIFSDKVIYHCTLLANWLQENLNSTFLNALIEVCGVQFWIVAIVVLLITYGYIKAGLWFSENLEDSYMESGGKFKRNRLWNRAFIRQITRYGQAEEISALIKKSTDKTDIYKERESIIITYKENGYTKEKTFYFGELTEDICKENCLDFTVLDKKTDEIFKKADILQGKECNENE